MSEHPEDNVGEDEVIQSDKEDAENTGGAGTFFPRVPDENSMFDAFF